MTMGTSTMTSERFEMAASAERIPATAQRIARLGATAGLDAQACFQLQVVVTEVLNNIVQHALRGDSSASVEIRCGVGNGGFEVTTVDHGLPMQFPPTRNFPETQAESSRGWPIIFSWVDHVDFSTRGDGNVLTLRKNLP